jgi:hypothetical protein
MVYVETDYIQRGDVIVLTHAEGPVSVVDIVWESGSYFEPETLLTVQGPSGVRTFSVPMGSTIAKVLP